MTQTLHHGSYNLNPHYSKTLYILACLLFHSLTCLQSSCMLRVDERGKKNQQLWSKMHYQLQQMAAILKEPKLCRYLINSFQKLGLQIEHSIPLSDPLAFYHIDIYFFILPFKRIRFSLLKRGIYFCNNYVICMYHEGLFLRTLRFLQPHVSRKFWEALSKGQ